MSVITRTAAGVLSYQAALTRKMLDPGYMLADYFQIFMDDAVKREKGHQGSVSMFYPVVPRGGHVTHDHGEQLAKIVGADLQVATTYQVTGEITGIMRAMWTRSVADVVSVDEAEMPCEAGFAWFDDGWEIIDQAGGSYLIRAISWRYVELRGDLAGVRGWHPAARFTLWVHPDDDPPEIQPESRRITGGNLAMIHTAVVPFGVELARPDGDCGESFLGVVSLLWMFLGMEITTTAKAKVQNHYRKQALKTLKNGDVNVILLRRVRHVTESEPGGPPVDWTCRWIVHGHHRHHVAPDKPHHAVPAGADKHCAVCGGPTEYVKPYLKGPDGKPLRIRDTVMRLAR